MILLDTNILSELMRPSPALAVERWLGDQPSATLFTSTVTEAELLVGLALLPEGRRRTQLSVAVAAMLKTDFEGRILPFDSAAARVYAEIISTRRLAGRPISQSDAQIAAIARSRDALLATRNVTDFEGCGVTLINPWNPDKP